MISVEKIEAWRGHQVVDSSGESLGKLDEVYFDTATGTPMLIAVKSGLLGRHSTLIPIDGAAVGPDYVRVAHAKDAVDRAAASAGEGAPDAEQLGTLGGVYGLKFSDRVKLESANDMETRRAEAEAARARAEELAAAASDRIAERDAAHERAKGASDEAGRAEREAEQARRAALEAREQARRYETP